MEPVSRFAVDPSQYDVRSFADGGRGTLVAWAWDPQIIQQNISQLATGRMDLTRIYLRAGQTVTNIIYESADTPANGPTHYLFGLYDILGNVGAARTQLGVTADQLTAAWAANTRKTLALTAAYPVTKSGYYYTAIMVAASVAVPTLIGTQYRASTGPHSQAPAACGFDNTNTGLTTTLPNPCAALTNNSNCAWSAVS